MKAQLQARQRASPIHTQGNETNAAGCRLLPVPENRFLSIASSVVVKKTRVRLCALNFWQPAAMPRPITHSQGNYCVWKVRR